MDVFPLSIDTWATKLQVGNLLKYDCSLFKNCYQIRSAIANRFICFSVCFLVQYHATYFPSYRLIYYYKKLYAGRTKHIEGTRVADPSFKYLNKSVSCGLKFWNFGVGEQNDCRSRPGLAGPGCQRDVLDQMQNKRLGIFWDVLPCS
jgi:hypothetical protein